ncbi:MAG: hypothetical protein K0R09_2807 [Clostridiales bacterium]|nr:hypothetical protein [Clostridiales bacterium]
MKIKGLKILIIVFSLIITFTGCEKNKGVTSEKVSSNSTPIENQDTSLKAVDITDPVEIEKLWQEYFYDAITTVCNARDFNSPEEIDPISVAQFCWYKYTLDKGTDDLALLNKDSTLRVFPLEIVLEYAKKYFNLTSLDVSKVPKGYEYDTERKAFIFAIPAGQVPATYTDKNPWGIHIDKVTRNSNGTITAVLLQYDTYETKRVILNRTLILKQREDGGLYFTSGRWEYINNNLVTIKGDYTHAHKIQGYNGSMEKLSMVGEVDGKLIIAYAPFNEEKASSLMLVNPDSLSVEKTLELEKNINYTEIRQTPNKLIACFDDKIMTYSRELERLEEILLPAAVRDKIKREPKYDSEGRPEIFFGGYDVSSDLTKLVYSDEEGIKLYNLTTGSERLLSKTKDAEGDKFLNKYYYSMPRFVSEDKKIITVVYGYECIRNYTLYDLKMESVKVLEILSDGNLGVIRYDTGLIGINIPNYNEAAQKQEYGSIYLDFKNGYIAQINLEDQGDAGYIVPDYFRYVGQNYAAFVTGKFDSKDNAKSTFYINHLNLRNMELKPKLISITATDPHILGVLKDGRIIFWYNLNPSESGICVTH